MIFNTACIFLVALGVWKLYNAAKYLAIDVGIRDFRCRINQDIKVFRNKNVIFFMMKDTVVGMVQCHVEIKQSSPKTTIIDRWLLPIIDASTVTAIDAMLRWMKETDYEEIIQKIL